jgi:hypothetical protein
MTHIVCGVVQHFAEKLETNETNELNQDTTLENNPFGFTTAPTRIIFTTTPVPQQERALRGLILLSVTCLYCNQS